MTNGTKSKRKEKQNDKILRVWAKNQLTFDVIEKVFGLKYENLYGKLIFKRVISYFLICRLIQHWNITPIFSTFFSVSGNISSPPLSTTGATDFIQI